MVEKLHAKLEDPDFIIYRDIVHNVYLRKWPLATLTLGQGQLCTYMSWVSGVLKICVIFEGPSFIIYYDVKQ